MILQLFSDTGTLIQEWPDITELDDFDPDLVEDAIREQLREVPDDNEADWGDDDDDDLYEDDDDNSDTDDDELDNDTEQDD